MATLVQSGDKATEAGTAGDPIEHEHFEIAGLPVDPVDIPDSFAPMIRNAWYVIARRDDVDRTLRGIKALGQPLVFYRSESGEAIVLDDRCAHRRFPLSKSRLKGDVIECGYHGFQYVTSGRCIWAPGISVKPKFGVRRYPAVEAGPWLWAWMGDPDKADPADIPLGDYLDGDWHIVDGYKHNPGNYMLLIENLLDLTHLHFLHRKGAADSYQAAITPPKGAEVADGVGWNKIVEDDTLGIMATWCGGDPTQPVRSEQYERQHGPALNVGIHDRFAKPGDDRQVKPGRFRVLHALTPADLHNTHQFYAILLGDPLTISADDLRHLAENVTFEEDIEAIDYMQEAILEDTRSGHVEFFIAGDRFGAEMRRRLRKMKAAETA